MDEWWKFQQFYEGGSDTHRYSYLKGNLEEAMKYCKKASKNDYPLCRWKANIVSEEEIIKDGRGFVVENPKIWMIKERL